MYLGVSNLNTIMLGRGFEVSSLESVQNRSYKSYGMHITTIEYVYGSCRQNYARPSLISRAKILSGSRPRTSGRSKLNKAPAIQQPKKTAGELTRTE